METSSQNQNGLAILKNTTSTPGMKGGGEQASELAFSRTNNDNLKWKTSTFLDFNDLCICVNQGYNTK